MKAPSVPVETAQIQAERYWRASADAESGRSATQLREMAQAAALRSATEQYEEQEEDQP